MSNNTVPTVESLNTRLKSEIYSLLNKYRQVFVHRSKMAAFCTDISLFYKSLSKVPADPARPTLENLNAYQNLFDLIRSLSQEFDFLSEKVFFQSIINRPVDYYRNIIIHSRESISRLILELFPSQDSSLAFKAAQFEVDDLADNEALIQVLQNYSQMQNAHIRIEEIQRIINQSNADHQDKSEQAAQQKRAMTNQEVSDQLQEFKEFMHKNEDFENPREIGSGAFSKVYVCIHSKTHKIVAVKKLNDTEFTVKSFANFKREITVLSQCPHFAIIPFIGFCITPPFSIITEYMSGSSLFSRLHSQSRPLNPTNLTIIALGVAYGMTFLHQKGIIHRDLKSLNVLLDADDYPRISDFGISRPLSHTKKMTGQTGTVQWEAPEVLSSSEYSEKADVYSYGVVLWEMLTKDAPYKGMKDIQIAMNVVSRDIRPLIPLSSPPKLAKLIQICWDKNPQKRPDFSTIVKAFETSEISFPGTDDDSVKSYISRCNPTPESQNNSLSIDSIFGADHSLAISSMRNISKSVDSNASSLIPLLPKIGQLIDSCDSSSFAFEIVLFVDSLLYSKQILEKAINIQLSECILLLFLKFGNSSMGALVRILQKLIDAEPLKPKISAECFSKLSNFLISGDVSVRESMTDLLFLILKVGAFESEIALCGVVANVVANIQSEVPFLEKVLKLVQKLAEIPRCAVQINKLDGCSTFLPLLKTDSEKIVEEALRSIDSLLWESQPTLKFVTEVFNLRGVEKMSSELQLRFLSIMNYTLRSQSAFKEVSDSFISEFSKFFKSKDDTVLIMTLKICYAFLSDSQSCRLFCSLSTSLISLLSSKSSDISTLAADCIVLIIPHLDYDLKDILTAELKEYIKNGGIASLRLIGVLSNSIEGANFVADLRDEVKAALESSDRESRRLAILIFTAQSSTLSNDKRILSVVDAMVTRIDEEESFILAFLSNICTHHGGAEECVKHFSKLIALLRKQSSFGSALKIILRIEKSNEVESIKLSETDINEIYDRTKPYWQSSLARSVFETYSLILAKKENAEVAKHGKICEELNSYFKSLPVGHSMRPTLVRIISRLS